MDKIKHILTEKHEFRKRQLSEKKQHFSEYLTQITDARKRINNFTMELLAINWKLSIEVSMDQIEEVFVEK